MLDVEGTQRFSISHRFSRLRGLTRGLTIRELEGDKIYGLSLDINDIASCSGSTMQGHNSVGNGPFHVQAPALQSWLCTPGLGLSV